MPGWLAGWFFYLLKHEPRYVNSLYVNLLKLTLFISRFSCPCCAWLGSTFVHVERDDDIREHFKRTQMGVGYNGIVPVFLVQL